MSEDTNFKSPFSGMDKYGKPRLELAMFLRDKVLKQLAIPWTIENGTLLGAWRNGKFIIHDDDFDIALYFEKNPVPVLAEITNTIKTLLPAPYKARLVSSYSNKIEVFVPSYGIYTLPSPQHGGADFHHVTVDLQCYERNGDVYRQLSRTNPRVLTVNHADVFPIGSIVLEGESFQAPGNVISLLKNLYGSLSPKAKFNAQTGFYEDPVEMNGTT